MIRVSNPGRNAKPDVVLVHCPLRCDRWLGEPKLLRKVRSRQNHECYAASATKKSDFEEKGLPTYLATPNTISERTSKGERRSISLGKGASGNRRQRNSSLHNDELLEENSSPSACDRGCTYSHLFSFRKISEGKFGEICRESNQVQLDTTSDSCDINRENSAFCLE